MNRKQALITGAATLAVLAAIPLTSALADTTPKRDQHAAPVADAPSTLLAAMRRDLGITDGQARTRLAQEAAAPTIERRLHDQLGDTYAGAWFDASTNKLVVGVTDSAKAKTVTTEGATPKVVTHSERDLTGAKDTLDRSARSAGKSIHSWYVDPASNSVVVVADASATAQADQFVKTSGAKATAVRVVTGAEAPKPLYDVRGGDQYVINSNVLCSVGFSVVGGFVTAGHCGAAGSPTLGFNNVGQGTFQASVFPGHDWAWVKVNSNWTPQPWVNNYAGGNAPVAGSNEAAIGSSVCRSGRTTGWRCGTIQAKNVTVNYSAGAVPGLTQTSACAEGGDSGGAWLTGDQAQGVTSGGSGNCTSGGTTFFQPVNPILSTYGLSLVTTGGSSTTSIVGYNNRCIDIPSSNAVDGAPLQIWDCNNTGAQKWTWGSDNSLQALGKCMDVAWGSTADGAVIQLANCSGNPAQKFVLSGAGDLVNPQANKCVDVKDWNGNNGGRLILYTCTGGANQKWRRG